MSTQPAWLTKQTSASFEFTADPAGSRFECSLDPVTYAGPFTACTSGRTYPGLIDGEH